MDGGPSYCTGGRAQNHPKEKKKARRQSRYLRRLKKEGKQKNKGDKGKLYLTKCRFPKNNTERQ